MGKLELKYITKAMPLVTIKKKNKKQKNNDEKQLWELRGINLNINDGEAIGILGDNGSGKSTLLKIIAGIINPTTGFITTKANITYASLQGTLDPELSGVENIRRALSKSKVEDFKDNHIIHAILNFTELGEWLYSQVKNYSISQYARLSLGIALFLEPDIVLLDSLFGVLDQAFYLKVADKIQSMKDKGISFIIADSKSIVIQGFCERVLWLQYGEMQDFGPTAPIVQKYDYSLDWYNSLSLPEKNDYIIKKQKEQINFNVNNVYEEFKIEQFRQGYKRTDESRMRKAFFSEKRIDPVHQDQVSAINKKEKTKKKNQIKRKKSLFVLKLIIIIIILGILIIGGSYLLKQNKSSSIMSPFREQLTHIQNLSNKI